MSACVALAWSMLIVPLLAAAVLHRPAQATPSTVSVIQTALVTPARPSVAVQADEPPATWTVQPGDTLSSIAAALAVPGGWSALYAANKQAIGPDPNAIRPGTILVLPWRAPSARYQVAPGDTLSGIAAALAVPGGWPALYAANRQAIGPNPNLIRPGVTLMSPRVPQQMPRQVPQRLAPRTSPRVSPRPRHQAPSSAPASTLRPSARSTAPAASATYSAPTGGMPRWLEDVLLAVGLLAASAFASEPVAVITRRRRRQDRQDRQDRQEARRPGRRGERHPARPAGTPAQCAAARARIILADHERLIVTYSTRDDTVYVLTPPGEDPRDILRAARLILPESAYRDLADYLGVPSGWPVE